MKKLFFYIFVVAVVLSSGVCFAQEETMQDTGVSSVAPQTPAAAAAGDSVSESSTQASVPEPPAPEPERTLADLLSLARQAKDKSDYNGVYDYVAQAMARFGAQARAEGKSLSDFPPADQMSGYATLNGVAEAQFVKAETLKIEGKKEEAAKAFTVIIEEYKFAQAWDPRGWYYKLSEVAQEAVDRLLGRDPNVEKCGAVPPVKFELHDPGKEEIVNYAAYGRFEGAGTKDYKYVVDNQEALSEAVGEGIYPNTTSVRWDPKFQEVKKQKRLEGNHWDFVHSPDLEAAFFRWALAPEPPGIRLYYTALILEKAGLIKHAIKAYYAVVVHFPHTVGWTYWHTPWYVGQASVYRIKYLCKKYPQVNMKLVDARIQVENGYDDDLTNDVFIVNPGKIVKNHIPETISDKVKKYMNRRAERSKIQKKVGSGKVRLVQYHNGDWQLLVENKPYVIRGVTYAVAKVGQSPDDGTLQFWMDQDDNKNGLADGPYDAFVDADRNGRQDADEPAVGDFELMKRMGVNTIRLYHQPIAPKKEILRDLYKHYGIRTIIGDFVGKYALGSGAAWHEGTDYENPEHQKAMLASVRRMVMEHKDEPYLLMWILGNENVYGLACNADKKPESFFRFVNEAAKLIKSLDPDHPVAIASGDTLSLNHFAAFAPDVDIFGANVYRGEGGFGSFWQSVKELTDKPVFITEYGCSAYVYCKTEQEAEKIQADYLQSCWEDIEDQMAFAGGYGNAIGGVLFEYLDEWWKGYEPGFHDTKGLWVGPFPDGYMHEEWLGVVGQGDGALSPFLRQPRKAYDAYQKLWKK